MQFCSIAVASLAEPVAVSKMTSCISRTCKQTMSIGLGKGDKCCALNGGDFAGPTGIACIMLHNATGISVLQTAGCIALQLISHMSVKDLKKATSKSIGSINY